MGAGAGHAAARPPKVGDVTCVERCAGARQAATGATVRLSGRRLSGTVEVRFPGTGGGVAAVPAATGPRAVEVVVPDGAVTGRPLAVDSAGRESRGPRLEIVPDQALPPRGGFDLTRASTRPRKTFFDSRRGVRLRYRFSGYGPLDLRATLVRRTKVVRSWEERNRAPFARHSLSWNGLTQGGGAGPSGRYRFRLGPAGGGARPAARFRLYDHRFPVRGGHSYGDRFGVPRSGGRTHEGQDLWAGCGTRLEAARGGSVQFRGYSGALYGHYLVIDGRQTDRDYIYAHLLRPPPVKRGGRVRTGERIGAVGRSGNARGEGCQLHFELWPSGWHQGRPRDPLRELRRWDRWS
jgi:murein DD-endopeptidase MepM/ murein hydrolase activator NlpD